MTVSSGPIASKTRILDLHSPILSALQKEALDSAARMPVELSANSILKAAERETGLRDFGPDDFHERLEIQIETVLSEDNLTDFARRGFYNEAVRFASNRLRVEDVVRRHPEILDQKIDRPLIIAGLPRSGTTHLQNFLGADTNLRSLPWWEALHPVPACAAENGNPAVDPRYRSAEAAWKGLDALLPLIKMVHPFDPDHISEDTELQGIDFTSYHLEWLAPNHLWADHYWNRDQTASYQYLKKVLQVLTWLRGPSRWLLKSPQHMEQLRVIHKVFPDATIVITHRDPVASIQSAITSLSYSARTRMKRPDPDRLAAYWVERYRKLLSRCVADHDTLPPSQVQDVLFDELIANPMAIVDSIYQKANLSLEDPLRKKMTKFLENNAQGKHGSLDYDIRRDFGLDPGRVRDKFKDYTDRFPVQVEVV